MSYFGTNRADKAHSEDWSAMLLTHGSGFGENTTEAFRTAWGVRNIGGGFPAFFSGITDPRNLWRPGAGAGANNTFYATAEFIGPMGPPGGTGGTGPKGDSGPAGADGADGADGDPGSGNESTLVSGDCITATESPTDTWTLDYDTAEDYAVEIPLNAGSPGPDQYFVGSKLGSTFRFEIVGSELRLYYIPYQLQVQYNACNMPIGVSLLSQPDETYVSVQLEACPSPCPNPCGA